MFMDYIIITAITVLGAIVGSFLNVVIYRYNTGVSALSGRSFCFSCAHTLGWYDLVPLGSFILQRGRCRYCKTPLSWQYPLVETATAVLFFLMAVTIIPPASVIDMRVALELAVYLVMTSLLVVITVYDIRHTIIPNPFVYTFDLLTLLPALGIIGVGMAVTTTLLAGPLLALPFALLWLISQGRWLGLGDAKLVLGMGWLLGLSGGLAAVMIAFWAGAIIGLLLMAVSRARRWIVVHTKPTSWIGRLLGSVGGYTIKSEIPFGPFLVAATFFVFFYDITFLDIQYLLTFS